MIALRLMLLGGFEARLASGAAVSLPTQKARALLAYLGLRPGQAHQRDMLAALLWGERSEEHARDGLRHALVILRKALSSITPPSVLTEGHTLALNPAAEVDVVTFERLVREGTPEALEQAVELYRGDLLLGFSVKEPLFEDWLVAERERLREVALEALARLLAHQGKAGRTERAIQTAVRLLKLDPLQEAAHRTLMRLYARQGRRGAALKQYQMCVGVLRRELGTEPETETKALYQELLRRPAEAAKAADSRATYRARPAPTAAPARSDLAPAETPLFGREVEMEQLRRLLDDALRGHGRLASVTGEAGIGKTRLLSVLAAEALSRGCQVVMGRCYESDSILPFAPWVDACRRSRISTDEEVLGALSPAWRAELTRLFPEATAAGLPAPSDSDLRLFEAIAQLVEQAAARQPLVLLLEDLHWADEMSLRLLAFLSRRISTLAALLITTAREEDLAEASVARRIVNELSRGVQAVPLVLRPLSRSDTIRIVHALARAGSAAQTIARLEEQVWAVSEGNPFVAIETARALQDGTIAASTVTLHMPEQVRELIATRLDRLSNRARELASVAAVIGREFEFDLLQRASGVDERATAKGVEELVRRHVLRVVGECFDFSHQRVRDVAYGRILSPRRQLLHRRVAEALSILYAESLESHRLTLGLHYAEGRVWDKAVVHLRQAGARAFERSANREAVACFERALVALAHLPENPSTLEQGFEIRLELRPALSLLGEARQALDRLREAETLAEQLTDDSGRGRVRAFMTNIHMQFDELDEALASGARALTIARSLGDLDLQILTMTYLAEANYFGGEYKCAVELATKNLAALPAERIHERFGNASPVSVYDRNWLVSSCAELGRFHEAATYAAEAVRIAEQTNHAFTLGIAFTAARRLHILKGDWLKARSVTERGIEVVRTGTVYLLLPPLIAASAVVLAQLGETGAALDRLQEAEQLLERKVINRRNLAGVYSLLSRACLLLGRFDQALSLGNRAVESSEHQPGFAAHARHLLADIATHPERFDAHSGEAHYRAALALAEPRGMRPLVAHCQLGLGRLYRRTAKTNGSAERLATATAMYRDMGMTYWLERAESELKEHSGSRRQ